MTKNTQIKDFSQLNLYIYSQIQYLIIDIMKDIFLAYIFYLLIEGPFTNISGYLFGRKSAKEVKDEIHLNNNNEVSKL